MNKKTNLKLKTIKKFYINPINYYTGTVSAFAVMTNWLNGYRKFPKNMGNTIRPKKTLF